MTSLARDVSLAIVLGFGHRFDEYVLATTLGLLVQSSLYQLIQSYLIPVLVRERGLGSRRARAITMTTIAGVVSVGAIGWPLFAALGLPHTLELLEVYYLTTVAIPIAAAAAVQASYLHVAGKSSYALATPFLTGILGLAAAWLHLSLGLIALSQSLGWFGDLIVLTQLRRSWCSGEQLPVERRSKPGLDSHRIVHLVALQGLLGLTVLIDRVVASHLGTGVPSATALANRFILGLGTVLVGTLIPHLTREAASRDRLPPVFNRRVMLLSLVIISGSLLAFAVSDAFHDPVFTLALELYAAGAPFFVLQSLLQAGFVGTGNTKWAMYLASVSTGGNALGDGLAFLWHSVPLLVGSTSLAGALACLIAVPRVLVDRRSSS